MSHVVRKYFADFEKEEQWLNDMSAKGLALVEYSWARYVFEESAPGNTSTGWSCWRKIRRKPSLPNTCSSWRRQGPSVCLPVNGHRARL